MAKADNKIQVKIEGNATSFVSAIDKANTHAKDYKETVEGLSKKSMPRLSRAFRRAATNASVLNGPLNGLSGRLSSLATLTGRNSIAWVGFGAAISGAAAIMSKTSRIAAEIEYQMARLEGVFMATGHAAGFTAEEIDKFGRELGLATLTSAEEVREAAAALATFTAVGGENFKRTISLAQDLNELFGGGLRGNVVRLGRAMDDPINGLKALKRSGVSFTQTQRDMIKNAIEHGQYLKAQGMLLDAVADQVEGTAERVASETVVGAWDTFTDRVRYAFEQLGKFTGATGWTRTAVNKLAETFDAAGKSLDLTEQFTEEELYKKIEEARKKHLREGDGFFNKNLRDYENYVEAYNQLYSERIKQEKAAAAGVIAQRKVEREKAAEVRKKQLEDIEKYAEKMKRKQEDLENSSSTLREVKVDHAYQNAVQRYAREFEAQDWWIKESVAAQEAYYATMLQLEMDYRRNKAAAIFADEEQVQRQIDAQIAKQEREDEKHRDLLIKNEEAKTEVRLAGIAAAEQGLNSLSQLMKEGSREQRALLVMEKALATSRAIISMNLAIAKANEEQGAKKYLAIAEAIGYGTQAIAGITAVGIAGRAGGGPVGPGMRYWVGEHGPEVVTFDRPGTVTKNEDLSPNINVNIVEDASRAGQVSQEGDQVNVFVAAAMERLSSDFSDGRGLFRDMENRYGLVRR